MKRLSFSSRERFVCVCGSVVVGIFFIVIYCARSSFVVVIVVIVVIFYSILSLSHSIFECTFVCMCLFSCIFDEIQRISFCYFHTFNMKNNFISIFCVAFILSFSQVCNEFFFLSLFQQIFLFLLRTFYFFSCSFSHKANDFKSK